MKQTAEICTSLISQRIIDRLWETVDKYQDDDSYIFILSVQNFGYEKAQDIIVLHNNTATHQIIIGCKPVDLTIEVNKNGNDYYMSLIPSAKAANEMKLQKNNRVLTHLREIMKQKIGFLNTAHASPAPISNTLL